jgi:hypothetical protein
MRVFVLWAGPSPPPKADLFPGEVELVAITEGEGTGTKRFGSSAFSRLGQKFGNLDNLARAHNLDLADFDRIVLGGFSAGHGLLEHMLRSDAHRVDVLLASDAYYTSNTPGAVKRGYRAFVERAAAGEALALLTCSSIGGPNYPSSDAAVDVLLEGLPLEPRRPLPLDYTAALPEPVATLGTGGLYWLRYDKRIKHGQHASRLAPELVAKVVTPYLEGDTRPGLPLELPNRPGELGTPTAVAVILAALAAAALL